MIRTDMGHEYLNVVSGNGAKTQYNESDNKGGNVENVAREKYERNVTNGLIIKAQQMEESLRGQLKMGSIASEGQHDGA